MSEIVLKEVKRKMSLTIEGFHRELNGLRTGRASANLLEPVMVEAYGSMMPLSQVGTIGAADSRLLTVQVWDAGLVKPVDKAIRDANLGLNPIIEGSLVRIPLPDLTEERRRELTKIAAKYAEQAKVSLRHVRRDGLDSLKKTVKEENLSEDTEHQLSAEIQKITEDFTKQIDTLLEQKEKDIMRV